MAAKLRTAKWPVGMWLELVATGLVLGESYRVEVILRRHGYQGTKEEFAHGREKIVVESLAAMSDAEKRAFIVDFIAGDFHRGVTHEAQRAFHKELVKLLGIDAIALAKRVADENKQSASPRGKTSGPQQQMQAKSPRKKAANRAVASASLSGGGDVDE